MHRPPISLKRSINSSPAASEITTLFWAEYNAKTDLLTYVNAGHPPPILICPTGAIERLNSGGLPIGMFAKARYKAAKLQMGPGSRLVIFTDGLTDAQNAAEEEFGNR